MTTAEAEPGDLVAYVRETYAARLPADPAADLADFYDRLADDTSRARWLAPIVADAPTMKFAHDVCAHISAELLRRGDPLPVPLAAWAADVIERRQPRPTTGAKNTAARDALIRFAVTDLRSRGIYPTGNEMSSYESGCEIVADAFGVSVDVANRVWADRRLSGWGES